MYARCEQASMDNSQDRFFLSWASSIEKSKNNVILLLHFLRYQHIRILKDTVSFFPFCKVLCSVDLFTDFLDLKIVYSTLRIG